ncbi:hypothetical protein DRN72_01710 [Methanosarcinales archaeon]|nr:MAG: hypothetical protein DRN72_01710 [Methanosarcinales archaeon]
MVSLEPLFILIGAITGVLITLTSIGGGVMMTPLLIYAGVSPVHAIGANFFYVVFVKTYTSVRCYLSGDVNIQYLKTMLRWGILGILVGFSTLKVLKNFYDLDLILVYVVSAVVMGALVFYIISELGFSVSFPRFALAGFIAGLMTQMSSIGSGVFGLLLLSRSFSEVRTLVGTNMIFSIIITLIAGIGYITLADIDVVLTLTLMASSVPGVWVGMWLKNKIHENSMRILLFVILTLSASLMLMKLWEF